MGPLSHIQWPHANACAPGRAARVIVVWIVAVAGFVWPSRAAAYAWMIRHEYTGCVPCHADPSGGGLLTSYGRAQGELLLRTRYGAPNDEEAGRLGGFLFGAIDLPEDLLLGGDARYFVMKSKAGDAPANTDNFLMQADATAQLTLDRARANASVGYAQQGAFPAALTHGASDNLVSRVHWIGIDVGDERQWLIRAGRMNLPFGIRSIEHTMFVRSATRTDINSGQQYGVAVAYGGEVCRAEAMGIAGNFLVAPDAYRERGYGGYVECSPSERLAIGASSLGTHASRDVDLRTERTRQVDGAFVRYAPWEPLVVLAEADLLIDWEGGGAAAVGTAGMLQTDVELIQGVHVMATGELLKSPSRDGTSFAAWGSSAWFFAPHADVRIDAVYQSLASAHADLGIASLLMQLHLYL